MASARRDDRLKKLQAELKQEGHPIHVAAADAGDVAAMKVLVEQTHAQLGGIDIMLYVTGTNTPDRSLKRLNANIWNELLTVNLNGAYYLTAALLPAMREAKSGHLIYIGSISGLVPDVSGAAYQASKRGLLGLAHAIRVEEKENGIRTCVVCPGLVDTELMEKRPVKPTAETLQKALQPIDVAELVLAIAKLPARVAVPEVQILPTVL